MESDMTDIYGFNDFLDGVYGDEIDDMVVADIDMDIFDRANDFHPSQSVETPEPLMDPISSPIFNPDDFLNDVDSEDVITVFSDRSSPSLSNSPSSANSSSDNIKNDSSSDESINIEDPVNFNNCATPVVVNTTPVIPLHSTPIRILQGTLIPVSTIKIEPSTVTNGQRAIFPLNGSCLRSNRNKVVLPKLSNNLCGKAEDKYVQQTFIDPISEKALKKQQRMIKNRESASLSRTKRREYVTSLESQIRSLQVENSGLKNENNNLKVQISNMLSTCQCRMAKYTYFTKAISPQTRKNAAILLAMVFMVSMSLGNFNSLLNRQTDSRGNILTPSANDHIGRGLLWADEYNSSEDDSSLKNVSRTFECISALNRTENSRIETDLRNWIGISDNLNTTQDEMDMFNIVSGFHSILKPNVKVPYRIQKNYLKRKNPHVSPDMTETRRRRASTQQSHRGQKSINQMQLFYPLRRNRNFSKLFEEIGRRDDTFYVLSFNTDHLLLSAANYNNSARPRMSFVLPADDSSENGKMTLMQIDCQVMNTSVFELKKEFIPLHLRTPATGRSESSNEQLNSTRSFNVPNKHDIFEMVNRSFRNNRAKHNLNKIYKPYFIEKSNLAKDSTGDFSEVFLT